MVEARVVEAREAAGMAAVTAEGAMVVVVRVAAGALERDGEEEDGRSRCGLSASAWVR